MKGVIAWHFPASPCLGGCSCCFPPHRHPISSGLPKGRHWDLLVPSSGAFWGRESPAWQGVGGYVWFLFGLTVIESNPNPSSLCPLTAVPQCHDVFADLTWRIEPVI